MSNHCRSNGTSIAIGVTIFVVVIIIIVVVAFGCNGGWFNRTGQAYVALTQKKAPPAPTPEASHTKDTVDKVMLAQTTNTQDIDNSLYHTEDVTDAKFSVNNYFPDGRKDMESISGSAKPSDQKALDCNKISVDQLKKTYSVSAALGRFQTRSRAGSTRILGNACALRPWNEDFIKAQKRACERRRRRQASGCEDDDCVQFNESSFMYEDCDT
jgi:hypothetical protein